MKKYSSISNAHNQELVLKIVENEEEKLKAFVVRTIVYIHEQKCPYVEEFDKNDYTATQVLGLIGDEPVLTARIRYFGRVAKLERLAIRPGFRGRGFGHQLLQYMLWFCRQKGFNTFYLHAQTRLEAFYKQYGFRRVGNDFAFSDHSYIEMYAEFPQQLGGYEEGMMAVSPYDPMLINRPEGRWHVPGPIENSLSRISGNAPAGPGHHEIPSRSSNNTRIVEAT